MHRLDILIFIRSALAVVGICCGTICPASAQELNWAEKMFSTLKIDFGTVARGADTRYELVIENLYKETVTISNVGTTCGCSAAKPDRTQLGTHEKAIVEVVMDTKKFMRRKDSNVDVTVTFDGVNFKTVRVPITAYIRSDVVLTPGNANFSDVYYGESVSRVIDIAYAGRADWNIREVRGGSEYLMTELKQTARSSGRVDYQLVVMLKPGAPVGSFREQLVLLTDDQTSPEVPVLVEGRVKPDIVVTPETVRFADLRPGTEKTVNVVIKGNRPFAIDEILAESDRECFRTKFSKEKKNLHVLPLTLTAPAEPGEVEELFTVMIEGRETPVTFSARGQVR